MDGREQLGIQPRQAGEGFGIGAVALAGIVVDRPELTGIGDQHVMTEIPEQDDWPSASGCQLPWRPGKAASRGELAPEGSLRGRWVGVISSINSPS